MTMRVYSLYVINTNYKKCIGIPEIKYPHDIIVINIMTDSKTVIVLYFLKRYLICNVIVK